MSAWSHLANASHIDWVLQSLKNRPELWDAAWNAAWTAAVDAGRSAAWHAAWDAAWDAARHAARHAALKAVDEVEGANPHRLVTLSPALQAASCSISALAAYDDCEEYLSMTYEQLRAWALLSEVPQAVLLLPMKWVQEQQIGSAECVPNAIDNVQSDCYSDS